MLSNNAGKGSRPHEQAYTSQAVDHLGIVASAGQQIGLIEQIDARGQDRELSALVTEVLADD